MIRRPPRSTLFPYTSSSDLEYVDLLMGAGPMLLGHGHPAVIDAVRAQLEVMTNPMIDRKSTRLNSSHPSISYAVFCLKKKKRVPARQRPGSPERLHAVGHTS